MRQSAPHLQQVPHSVYPPVQSCLMQTCSTVGPCQLSVHVKAMLHQQPDDLIVALLGSQKEGCVWHVRPLQVGLRVLARAQQQTHHLSRESSNHIILHFHSSNTHLRMPILTGKIQGCVSRDIDHRTVSIFRDQRFHLMENKLGEMLA